MLKIKKQNILINNAGAGFLISSTGVIYSTGAWGCPNILFVFYFGKFVKDPLPIDNNILVISEIFEIIAVWRSKFIHIVDINCTSNLSVTYKLKLNGGDIKAVQGDSGHAQVNMVTDVYSHILDDDRRKNAELFEEAFYEKKNLDPQMHVQQENNNATVADEVDPELLAKVLANSEMCALLSSLASTMK